MRVNFEYLGLFIAALLHFSCNAPFVWAEHLSAQKTPIYEYRIQNGDQIEVVVWDQTQISGVYQVRKDGIIGIPLVGELTVAGATPEESAQLIKKRLEQGGIVHDVSVVVISRQVTPEFVSVLGEVESPTQIQLKETDTILDLIALAGGLTEFANKKSIYVLRPNEIPSRIRFDYNRLTSRPRYATNFKLKAGDIIIVE